MKIIFGSWMNDAHSVVFIPYNKGAGINSLIVDYIPHSLWYMKGVLFNVISSTDRYDFYDGQDEYQLESHDLSITFELKRLPLYFMMNNIFPSLILNCITLIAFALPFPLQITLCIRNLF